jgi:hypothetical protein
MIPNPAERLSKLEDVLVGDVLSFNGSAHARRIPRRGFSLP